jgi:hypothetical protein
MGINGLHGLFYTSEPERLRAMFRDVFGFNFVDAGGGWLIFGMPPAEVGVHPLEGDNFEAGHRHLMSFMCDDIDQTIAELRAKGVKVDPQTKDEGYGITTMLHLPGGCEVMLYEPRHPVALSSAAAKRKTASKARAEKRRAKTPARKSAPAAKRKASPQPGRRAKRAGRRR